MSAEFEAAIGEAVRLEKKLVGYAPYEGAVEIEKTLELAPEEYVDLRYADMLNQYERTQKIISTAGLGILATGEARVAPEAPAQVELEAPEAAPEKAAPAEEKPPEEAAPPAPEAEVPEPEGEAPPAEKSAEAEEIEARLREMTDEVLKVAEEVAREPIIETEAPPPEAAKPEEEKPAEIEFEMRPAEEKTGPEKEAPKPAEIEFERPSEAPPALEFEKPEEEAAPEGEEPEAPAAEKPAEERKEAPAPPRPAEAKPPAPPGEKKVVVATVPPALRESPDKAAEKRYERMEQQIVEALGEQADEMTLKKKMLDLTKQLFKEKTTSKREELKAQITVLKNMLAGMKEGTRKKPAATKKAAAGEAHVSMLDTILSTHQGELSQTKDTIIDSYNKQIDSIKKKFYEDISATEDPAARKKIFEAFVFSVESLVEQLPEVLAKYQDFTSKKHAAELEKLKESLAAGEKATRSKVDARLEYVRAQYAAEFASVRGIVGRQIENLVEVAGNDVFKAPAEKPEEAEARLYEAVKEINETDEGTLLYFLHSKDADYYKKYERKQISKAEAIFKAKELMAKEKGLDDRAVEKYFSQKEG